MVDIPSRILGDTGTEIFRTYDIKPGRVEFLIAVNIRFYQSHLKNVLEMVSFRSQTSIALKEHVHFTPNFYWRDLMLSLLLSSSFFPSLFYIVFTVRISTIPFIL